MKKSMVVLLTIFGIFFMYDNVSALSFNKCNSSINVDDSNFYYYVYDKLKNQYSINPFDTYNYFVVFKNTNDSYEVYFTNNISDYKIRYISSFKLYRLANQSSNSLPYYIINSNGTITNGDIPVNNTSNDINMDLLYHNFNLYQGTYSNGNYSNLILLNSNLSKSDLESYFICSSSYTITYYLNNSVYQTYTVESNSSHTLLFYEPSIEYEFSGWIYDNNIDLNNIVSDVNIYGTTTLKPTYTISYYLNNELYDSISVLKGTNYTLQEYIPPRHYEFSGWSYDSNIDLTNITSNVVITGTTTFVKPNIDYTDDVDSVIHNITLSIVGEEVPEEFDFIYTIFDLLLLLVLVITIISPFILVFKLLGVI